MNKYLELIPELDVKIFNSKALKEDLGITDEEIFFMTGLMFFPFNESVPTIKKGILQKKTILLDPICVALYDYYHGAEILLSRNVVRVDTEKKMKMAKSIFRKYSPENFIHCF